MAERMGSASYLPGARAKVSLARAPVLGREVYDAWHAAQAVDAPARNKRNVAIDGQALRRIVIMKRDGYTFPDIAASIGHTPSGVRHAYALLPASLR